MGEDPLQDRLDALHDDVRELRRSLTQYVLRLELLPMQIVVYGGVLFVILVVGGVSLLTVFRQF